MDPRLRTYTPIPGYVVYTYLPVKSCETRRVLTCFREPVPKQSAEVVPAEGVFSE